MAKNKKKPSKLKQKLTDKYRLVVLNEDTFQERFSLKLSRLNVFVFGGIFSIILITLTTFLIAFTSLKEYIPGYSSTKLKKDASRLTYEADSLRTRLAVLENFTKAIRPVLTGEIKPEAIDSIKTEVSKNTVIDYEKLEPSAKDLKFREEIQNKDRYALSAGNTNKAKIVFFAPVKGNLTQSFNAANKHFAIDIVATTGTPVKAIADGTVILSGWTTETGYTITVQHTNNYISVYKHNGELLKQQGDFVKSGEAIASIGSTGELTTGPHLHFELWHNGYPVNPTNYINFQ
ncbi:M23 family metallopeptidase [Tenacibaculum sp. M341]|uniref:M23 family metallopeptidase n=1 Tax=Tenacibaculum sp. M341 TaxID=2530339 RepID=UPI001053A2D2|nr:M23 family metallopeptidase [Tenacibaculum sp. M341]TCI93134.1 M23 family metallopeptidase [Tenacibaculum sp. M341]